MPDGRTRCPRGISAAGAGLAAPSPRSDGTGRSIAHARRRTGRRAAAGRRVLRRKKESAPIRRISLVEPRGAAATDCQEPGRSPVCGGGVGFPRVRGHRGTARVPESPTRTPPPQSRYIGLPQDHLLRRANFASGGSQPARPPDRPSPSTTAASCAEPLRSPSFDIRRRMSTCTPGKHVRRRGGAQHGDDCRGSSHPCGFRKLVAASMAKRQVHPTPLPRDCPKNRAVPHPTAG